MFGVFTRLNSFLFCLVSLSSALVPRFAPRATPAELFEWDVPTSEDLYFHECYERFQCARLTVPLDWNNSSGPHHVSLAIIKLPAAVPKSDPRHGGTIVLNPGGPGGSGVLWALQVAEPMQRLLDEPKFYDILSFDPRGVFQSTPNAYCFSSAIESEIWWTQKRAAGDLNNALKYNWALEVARGQLCADSENGMYSDGDNLRQHLSTAYVARDMLEIIEKVAAHERISAAAMPRSNTQARLGVNAEHKDIKLNYIGTSYGTFLGQTFASMFPEHIGRIVLDGNIDAENWVSRYEASVDDISEVHAYFFERCFAGQSSCPFYRDVDTSPDDIAARMEELLFALDGLPAHMTGHGHASPITSADILAGFFTTAYQPMSFFQPFAQLLNDLYTGVNPGQPFWQHDVPTQETFSDELLANAYQGGEVAPAVHCSDGPDLSDGQFAGFGEYLSNLTSRFGWAGRNQADFKIPCWTWPSSLRTKWRFDGPFGAPEPILFVNNRLDPVTPIRNARKMARRFTGSVALEHDGVGHGSLWPASPCMWTHVKDYMDSGKLPSPDTVCPVGCEPFDDDCGDVLDTPWYL